MGKKKKKKKNPGINPGQVRRLHSEPARKGPKKKKKHLGINPGQSAEKRAKKKKKTPGINLGQPAKPRFQNLDLRTWTLGPGFQDLGLRT